MPETNLDSKKLVQIGIIVKDLDKSAEAYAKFLGVPKPQIFMTDEVDKSHTEYRGKLTKSRIRQAFFELENIQLELIEPDEHPSTWKEFLDTKGEGIHHVAFVVKGMENKISSMDKAGFPLIQKGDYTGGCYSYIDTFGSLKFILEFLESF